MRCEWLVSKDLVAYHVPDKAALTQVVKTRDLKGKEAGNLRQLMGFDEVGGDRDGRHDSDNWQRYEDGVGSSKSVQCIQKNGSETLVVLVGKLGHRWLLAKKHAPEMPRDKLARLLNGSLKAVKLGSNIWRRGQLPPAVTALRNGQSIVTLLEPAESHVTQPAAAGAVGALPQQPDRLEGQPLEVYPSDLRPSRAHARESLNPTLARLAPTTH